MRSGLSKWRPVGHTQPARDYVAPLPPAPAQLQEQLASPGPSSSPRLLLPAHPTAQGAEGDAGPCLEARGDGTRTRGSSCSRGHVGGRQGGAFRLRVGSSAAAGPWRSGRRTPHPRRCAGTSRGRARCTGTILPWAGAAPAVAWRGPFQPRSRVSTNSAGHVEGPAAEKGPVPVPVLLRTNTNTQ